MTLTAVSTSHITEADVLRALDVVIDPELDEPITDLGFVRSITITPHEFGSHVEVHLRLPTSFCAPNFAYLMSSDAKDALLGMQPSVTATVELDEHHDSEIINAGLAADAGYLGTFKHEAEMSLDDLRLVFKRKAHTAAMERCITELLRSQPEDSDIDISTMQLNQLLDGRHKISLLQYRAALGISVAPVARVLVNECGEPYPANAAELALRRARSTRISIDGNAHFCRGLLATRYADEVPAGPSHRPLIPLTPKEPSL